MIKISDMKFPVDYTEKDIQQRIAKELRIEKEKIKRFSVARRSVDARKKNDVKFIISVNAEIEGDEKKVISRAKSKNVTTAKPFTYKIEKCREMKNPPVIVDETADIEQAAADIVAGASLDNNMPCIAEKEVLAVDSIFDYLMFNMEKNNAFKISKKEDMIKLEKALINPDGTVNKKFVGKDAKYILDTLGIECSYDPRLIIMETHKEHPFAVEELMMPVLPLIRCKDFDEALELAVKLENGCRHTAAMHSKHIDRLTIAPRRLQTTIFVKNAPSYAGIGLGGEGYTSFTLASSTGDGITSTITFTRKRRCVLKNGLFVR